MSGNLKRGDDALLSCEDGIDNTGIGTDALSNVEGSGNTALGERAGKLNADGSPCLSADNGVYLGKDSKASADDAENEIAIGTDAEGKGSNTATLGNDSTTNTYLKGEVSCPKLAPTLMIIPKAVSAPVNAVVEVKSVLSTALVGDDNDLDFTSKLAGVLGDDIKITYVDPAGNDAALGIVVTGESIVVNLATGPAGAITSLASEIITAIENDVDANALVGVVNKTGNDGSGVVTALIETSLASGVDAVDGTPGYEGMITSYGDDLYMCNTDDFTTAQAGWLKTTLTTF